LICPRAQLVFVVQRVPGHGLAEAVVGDGAQHEPRRDRVGHGQVQHEVAVALAVFAEGQLGASFRFVHRFVGDEVDGAADDVLAPERALRPLEHFDALHVVEIDAQHGAAGEIDAVEEGDRRRIAARALVAAADAAEKRPRRGQGLASKFTPGVAWANRSKLVMPFSDNCLPVKAVTVTGVLCSDSARRRGDDNVAERAAVGGLRCAGFVRVGLPTGCLLRQSGGRCECDARRRGCAQQRAPEIGCHGPNPPPHTDFPPVMPCDALPAPVVTGAMQWPLCAVSSRKMPAIQIALRAFFYSRIRWYGAGEDESERNR
jgi:hypothetical protein